MITKQLDSVVGEWTDSQAFLRGLWVEPYGRGQFVVFVGVPSQSDWDRFLELYEGVALRTA